MTRVSNFCEHFIEAGWLIAVALVQLYVSSASNQGYAVAKVYFLRLLVPLMVAAWVVKLWEERRDGGVRQLFASLWKKPLALPVAVYVASVFLTALTSVAPGLSFYGSFERLQGAYTTLAYAAFFCMVAANLKRRDQFDRLVAVLILSSIPVCLYALAQQIGLDPARYAGPSDTLRWAARSTMGHHLFLGAYLIMVLPWTAAGLIEAGREYLKEERPREASRGGQALLAAGSLVAQNIAMTFFLLYGLSHPQLWWTNLSVLTAYVGLLIWTVRLQARIHPLIEVAGYTVILCLQAVALVATQARGPWLGALAGAVVFGFLFALRLRMRRLLTGVVAGGVLAILFVGVLNIPRGPLETLKRHPVLARLGSLSALQESVSFRLRLWPSVWRLVWTTPELRPADSLAGIRPLIGYGPETLGLVVEKTLDRRLAAREEPWSRVKDRAHNDLLNHLAEGGILGLAAFLVLLAAFARLGLKALWQEESPGRQLCLIALLAALAGHLAELQFGIGITSTRFLFWLFLALAVVLARPLPDSEAEGPVAGPSLWKSLTVRYALYVTVAVLAIVIVGLGIAFSIAGAYIGLLVALAGMLAGVVVLALEFGPLRGERRTTLRDICVYTLVLGVSLVLVYRLSFRSQAADTIFTLGQTNPIESVFAFQRAATLESGESVYQVALGRFLAQIGLALFREKPDLKPPEGFKPDLALARTIRFDTLVRLGGDGAMGLAEASIQEARRLVPRDGRYVYLLGRLHHHWGMLGNKEHLDTAIRYYREAAEMSPSRPSPLVHVALAYLAKNQPAQAIEQLQALQAPGYDSWGIPYALAQAYHRIGKPELARKAEEEALAKAPRNIRNMLSKLIEQGTLRPVPIPGPNME